MSEQNNSGVTVLETLSTVAALRERREAAQAVVNEIDGEISAALKGLVAATGQNSFAHDGKWIQIRTRGGNSYACFMDREPGSWLRKENRAAPPEQPAEPETPSAE